MLTGNVAKELKSRNSRTQASGGDALSNLVAEGLVEGDVAFFEDAVE